jgi:hypothetical protein
VITTGGLMRAYLAELNRTVDRKLGQ